jgi:hypothetical protein
MNGYGGQITMRVWVREIPAIKLGPSDDLDDSKAAAINP